MFINDLELNNEYYKVTSFSKTPVFDLQTFNNPLNNGKWFISKFVRWWSLSLELLVKWKNRAEFMQKIDDLYKEIFKKEVIFKLNLNWINRKIKVFCTSAPINFEHFNTHFVNLTLNFEYLDFWEDMESTILNLNDKSWNFSQNFQNLGNVPSEIDFALNFKWNSNISRIRINSWEEFFEVNQNFKAWDVLRISAKTFEVFKNNSPIDFRWIFLDFSPWENNLNFEFWWNVLVDISILFTKKYL